MTPPGNGSPLAWAVLGVSAVLAVGGALQIAAGLRTLAGALGAPREGRTDRLRRGGRRVAAGGAWAVVATAGAWALGLRDGAAARARLLADPSTLAVALTATAPVVLAPGREAPAAAVLKTPLRREDGTPALAAGAPARVALMWNGHALRVRVDSAGGRAAAAVVGAAPVFTMRLRARPDTLRLDPGVLLAATGPHGGPATRPYTSPDASP